MDETELRRYTERLEELKARTQEGLPSLLEARRRFFKTRSQTDQEALERIEADLELLNKEFEASLLELEAASGIDPALLDAYEQARAERHDGERDLSRKRLVDAQVEVTRSVGTDVSEALEHLRVLLPPGWLEAESREACRLHFAGETDFLSLTKGMRVESEAPPIHRFRQMLFVADDYRTSAPRFDHFAAATILPTVVHLGERLGLLDRVGGDVAGRLRRLWDGPSDDVDGTVFELLAAQACVEHGRSIEFIRETNELSPDIRCNDPIPLVIECKRQRPISTYELEEESTMRKLFRQLRTAAYERACYGIFHLTLTVEASGVETVDVVAALIAQRLAANPERKTVYAWGEVSYKLLSSSVLLPHYTRLYSPNLLRSVFDWNTDLPKWDGLCCWYGNDDDPLVDEVLTPIGLLWINRSAAAIKKRTWAPVNLFGAAANQVPQGEFAIIYLAYTEGAREEVADQRLAAFEERISAWAHEPEIRLPIAFVNRLYPRALGEGRPDLIESTVLMRSQLYGEPRLFEDFPSNVFTISPVQ